MASRAALMCDHVSCDSRFTRFGHLPSVTKDSKSSPSVLRCHANFAFDKFSRVGAALSETREMELVESGRIVKAVTIHGAIKMEGRRIVESAKLCPSELIEHKARDRSVHVFSAARDQKIEVASFRKLKLT